MASEEFRRLVQKYPNHVFVIMERAGRDSASIPPLDKNKFIVSKYMTVGEFMVIFRRRLRISSEKAIFFFIHNTIPTSTQRLGELSRDSDGFLRIIYAGEATFGSYDDAFHPREHFHLCLE
jgi:GABA(A) receptor-associated protein